MRYQNENPLNDVVRRAVELSRQPGTNQRESGAGRGGVGTREDIATTADVDGNTNHIFILMVDALGDPSALLSVQGINKNYGD